MTTSPVMAWLADGVPITLLCDLAATAPPDSMVINLNERPPLDLLAAEAAAPLVVDVKVSAG